MQCRLNHELYCEENSLHRQCMGVSPNTHVCLCAERIQTPWCSLREKTFQLISTKPFRAPDSCRAGTGNCLSIPYRSQGPTSPLPPHCLLPISLIIHNPSGKETTLSPRSPKGGRSCSTCQRWATVTHLHSDLPHGSIPAPSMSLFTLHHSPGIPQELFLGTEWDRPCHQLAGRWQQLHLFPLLGAQELWHCYPYSLKQNRQELQGRGGGLHGNNNNHRDTTSTSRSKNAALPLWSAAEHMDSLGLLSAAQNGVALFWQTQFFVFMTKE